ncbi:DUF1310 family protein [Listeria booriae]|uniref:DUF1310 family protein n=1 Tax=Listeria booriae TaxID=1552123 RepID=A0A7X1CAR4_9LIST|nr:DUF1310 family protein [Listeria booriae]MBC1490430.1 DUF1310 family protein [Listeria booriae]MBC2282817.1 DUF1310 family protein [Listeria booriae]MBC2292485.1 DUF1310 family protein [Listeria booriae]MBC2304994.1 DUF1310 family protein [Listeria booriae]MBC2310209.1 DUF1310 family protein [Listeria booriae]
MIFVHYIFPKASSCDKILLKDGKNGGLMKYLKIIGIVVVILAVIGIGIGVKYKMDQQKVQEDMVKVVKANEKLIGDDLKSQDKYHKIKSISINYDSIKKSPMGGIIVDGYVNNKKDLTFVSGLQRYDGSVETDGTAPRARLFDYLEKEEE